MLCHHRCYGKNCATIVFAQVDAWSSTALLSDMDGCCAIIVVADASFPLGGSFATTVVPRWFSNLHKQSATMSDVSIQQEWMFSVVPLSLG